MHVCVCLCARIFAECVINDLESSLISSTYWFWPLWNNINEWESHCSYLCSGDHRSCLPFVSQCWCLWLTGVLYPDLGENSEIFLDSFADGIVLSTWKRPLFYDFQLKPPVPWVFPCIFHTQICRLTPHSLSAAWLTEERESLGCLILVLPKGWFY